MRNSVSIKYKKTQPDKTLDPQIIFHQFIKTLFCHAKDEFLFYNNLIDNLYQEKNTHQDKGKIEYKTKRQWNKTKAEDSLKITLSQILCSI